uniref:Uncharacterized protein n=1 Tax=Globodera rostochiensis TaxID=31243 RepID=A0A914HV84_GLORO
MTTRFDGLPTTNLAGRREDWVAGLGHETTAGVRCREGMNGPAGPSFEMIKFFPCSQSAAAFADGNLWKPIWRKK